VSLCNHQRYKLSHHLNRCNALFFVIPFCTRSLCLRISNRCRSSRFIRCLIFSVFISMMFFRLLRHRLEECFPRRCLLVEIRFACTFSCFCSCADCFCSNTSFCVCVCVGMCVCVCCVCVYVCVYVCMRTI